MPKFSTVARRAIIGLGGLSSRLHAQDNLHLHGKSTSNPGNPGTLLHCPRHAAPTCRYAGRSSESFRAFKVLGLTVQGALRFGCIGLWGLGGL